MTLSTRVAARSLARLRAALAALLLFAGVAVLHACVIEERLYDEQLSRCTEYCDEVASKCTGENAIYQSRAQCLAVCEQIPLGAAGEPPGSNTLSCRLDRLRAGGFEVGIDCPAAGPGGNGTCGDDCASFCALRRQACSELQPNESDIAIEGFCEASCPGLAVPPGFSVAANDATDTLQCRLIQLARAFEARDPDVVLARCVQSQIVPENQDSECSDDESIPIERDCQTYCDLVRTSCTGQYEVYETVAQCMAACPTFERGVHGDISLNTLRCRRYHAYAALDVPSVHCAHAGPTGDGHCADPPDVQTGNCVSYCRILEQACSEQYAERFSGGLGGCISSCMGLPDALRDDFTAEPRYTTETAPAAGTLKCRTFHALRALSAPDEACASAFADPGSDCD